ncbi:HAD-IA family hydrolase [Kribbella sp. NPDC051770]|uniref:HAD-IA family hydrolase n=1 Tax=Kribbella sp. NPDC051770 TaxID=3155413 RepID=UPI0034305B5F
MTDLSWSGCLNTRDLAGLPTRYGGTTVAGLIRSDSLHRLDADGWAAFRAVGAGLVLDLRSDWEMTEPHPLDGSAMYRRIPWIDPVADKLRVAEDEPLMADIYRGSLDRNVGQILQVCRAVAAVSLGVPVVVHCRSGKDRTGLLVALLQELAGVPREVIAADFALSEAKLGTLERIAALPADEREAAGVVWRSLPSTILATLEHVDSRYGGVRAYLAQCGLTAREIHRLGLRLLTDVDIEAVVFDFDGLLMDTETTMVESWQAEWAYHGLSLDLADDFWPGHGGDMSESRYERLAALVPGFDRTASHARRTAHRDRLHASMDFRPGIREWLLEARELGLRVGIASSSARPWVVGHLERVDAVELFDVVATGDEVEAHKPDPAVYELALARLGEGVGEGAPLAGRAALAVEDTPHGVAAAAAAGMRTVGIPNPYVDPATIDGLVLASAEQLTLSETIYRLHD